jgi:tetratricopeptide (TPR) repeat protein
METDLIKNPDAYLNYFKANAGLLSAMGNKFPDPTNFRSVIALYDKAIEKDSAFAMAFARRAIARSWGIHSGEIDSTNCEKCWSDIDSASKIDSTLPEVDIAKGFYNYYCTKEYNNAKIDFNNAYLIDPENYRPLFYMAMVQRILGAWDEVKNLLKNEKISNSRNPLILTNIGLSYDYMHEYDTALVYHQKAIDIKPDWPAAYLNKIGTLCLRNGNTTAAHSLLDFVIRNFTEKQEELRIILDMYDRKYDGAFTKAVNASPSDFNFIGARLLYLANISDLMGNHEEAENYYDLLLKDLKQQLNCYPDNAYIHSYLGLAYAGKGNKEEAISESKIALTIVSEKNYLIERDIKINLAQIYTRLGMIDDALPIIKDSLKNPSLLSDKILKLDPLWEPLKWDVNINA